ncbi:hypothetical protein SARC_02611 [Sphaeroforma arctica JP610]|uniref:Uncharacterized protein n=1 Tax=Sphaeroforma arctica JP610 TaxID=667725 RepID=A0A0L0G834_9EUKA|nr:hypothetical protein SARC_02611 [Sphaeroforma arctica JP610]KNC85192.1 hypothetical protein SARC_02611 [Sphaeroforma arctica JP610]|eukprot:XP_014159094.1 hypothetical protein SARC_02611 [Sphaeroforma arctica JP610]
MLASVSAHHSLPDTQRTGSAQHNYNSEYLRSNPISFVVEAHTSRILLASRELPYNSKYNRIRESYLTQAPLDLLAFSKWSEGTERVTGEFLPPTVSDENCTCTVEELKRLVLCICGFDIGRVVAIYLCSVEWLTNECAIKTSDRF